MEGVRLPLARKRSNSTARPAAFGYSPESRSPELCTSHHLNREANQFPLLAQKLQITAHCDGHHMRM